MPFRFGSIPRPIAVRAVIILSLAAATGAGALARGGTGGPYTHVVAVNGAHDWVRQ